MGLFDDIKKEHEELRERDCAVRASAELGISGKVSKSDIVDNLTTNDATKVLSAKQGKALQDTKINISDIKDNLTSTDTNKPLSAKQGKVLDEKINGLYTEVTDNEPYTLRQGKGDMVDMELVGGSFAWNQLVQNGNFANDTFSSQGSNVSITVSGNVGTFNPVDSSVAGNRWVAFNSVPINTSHKYLFFASYKYNTAQANSPYFNFSGGGTFNNFKITTCTDHNTGWHDIAMFINFGSNTFVGNTAFRFTFDNVYDFSMKNIMLIDLTQLFGTTIADAIYTMEQATAGSGVAFFRKYFPNTYYAYDGGSIQSVCVSARKVVGKNLIDSSTLVLKPWNGNNINNTRARLAHTIKLPIGTTVTFSMSEEFRATYTIGIHEVDSDYPASQILSDSGWLSANTETYTLTTIANNVGFAIRRLNSENIDLDNLKSMQIQMQLGSRATVYEPYEEHVYPFDTTKQLRGIPSIVNNKLVYDGDIYTPNGITRKYGIVDLGSLSGWGYSSNANAYYADMPNDAPTAVNNGVEAINARYPIFHGIISQMPDKTTTVCNINFSSTKKIFIKDSSYSDATTLKNSLNGAYLVYPLANPTTESAEPYQNPQRSDANGTEEFVDYEYDWMHNRDVAIPVGHNTKYISSEVLAYSEDYADGLLKYVENDLIPPKADITALTNYDFSGMTTAPLSISKDDYFYMDGFLCKALVNINQGATLTYYTNYITCSVATELNELRNKTEWHEVLSGTQTLSTTEDETLMWTEQSYYPTYFGCDFFVFSDLAGFYLKDFSYGGHDGSITFPKWSSAVTVNYKIMARGEANQSGSGITTYYNAPILNQ